MDKLTESLINSQDTDEQDTQNWMWDNLDSDDELKVILQNKPNDEMNWLCAICYEWHKEEDDLEQHILEEHLTTTRFQKCQYCDKKFLTRFLCLRHEKLHKFDMKRPLSHYYPPKGKPQDYYVSNHFTKSLKPPKLSDAHVAYLGALTDRIENQKYECLECKKVFEDEELCREHYEIQHAIQQCIFCQGYFENFNILRRHQKDTHDYVYQERQPGGAWNLWEKERERDEKVKEFALAGLPFFHNYAKKPEDEPISETPIETPIHIRKSIIPPINGNKELMGSSIDLMARKICKRISETKSRHGMDLFEGIPPLKSRRRLQVPSVASAIETSTEAGDDVLTEVCPRIVSIRTARKSTPPSLDEDSMTHERVTSSVMKISPPSSRFSPPSELLNRLLGDDQDGRIEPSDSGAKIPIEIPLPRLKRKPMTPSPANSEDLDNMEPPELNPAGKSYPVPSLLSEENLDPGASEDELECHSDQEDMSDSDFSDTPPQLHCMTTLGEEEEDDEARDPEEEGAAQFTESYNYEDDSYAQGDMLFIHEDLGQESGLGLKLTTPYKCSFCDRGYHDCNALDKHLQTHSSERPFACQFCGQRFATQSNRKEHERIHTGERPYVCPYCQKGFTQISNLKKHISTHKEQNLRCLKCGKQFVKQSSLILHQRAHAADRRFRCHICDRAYNYASLLKRHMRIHTGELPYECDMCGMLFHELVSLHYHRKKIHTGERPHKCETCGRAFILSSDLKKHQNIHNKDADAPSTPEVMFPPF